MLRMILAATAVIVPWLVALLLADKPPAAPEPPVKQQTIADTEPGAVDRAGDAATNQLNAVPRGSLSPEVQAAVVANFKSLHKLLGIEDQFVSTPETYLTSNGWVKNVDNPGGLGLWTKTITFPDAAGNPVTVNYRVSIETAIEIEESLASPPTVSTLKKQHLQSVGWVETPNNHWFKEVSYKSSDGTTGNRLYNLPCDTAILTQQYIDEDILEEAERTNSEYNPALAEVKGIRRAVTRY